MNLLKVKQIIKIEFYDVFSLDLDKEEMIQNLENKDKDIVQFHSSCY